MGALYIVGIGPGNTENMTAACLKHIEEADIIVGYTGYLKLLRPVYPGKRYYESGMTLETERCKKAIRLAEEGLNVCMVSSGDSGVYGMASLIYELAGDFCEFEIKVIPGVTAALSGAALLGAPLSNDFAVISLSDLLTPWEVIEKRLCCAAHGDFVICLYNPGSKNRSGHLALACDILMEFMPEKRIAGIAANIGREGESFSLTNLIKLRDTEVGMHETVFIGNSTTLRIGGHMITPRGYHI